MIKQTKFLIRGDAKEEYTMWELVNEERTMIVFSPSWFAMGPK